MAAIVRQSQAEANAYWADKDYKKWVVDFTTGGRRNRRTTQALVGAATVAGAWRAADRAYMLHATTCPQCCAAGLNPGGVARCAVGADLWAAYVEAGDPPHFVWLNRTSARASA